MAGVLVCGIAVVDHVFYMDALPSQAEKYRATAMDVTGGGCAANAAVAIARLGGAAQLVTRLGADATGDMIRADLGAEGVDMAHTIVTRGARSPMSSVCVDASGERMIVNFPGEGLAKTAPVPPLPNAVLADTRWPEAATAICLAARHAGLPAVLDAEAPVPLELAKAASHVVFSAQGLRQFSGQEAAEAGLRDVQDRLSGWVAVTDGARGLCYLDAGRAFWLPPPQVDVVDTLGAGDVWHGAFALALAEGSENIAAVRFAHAAAALKCTASGGRAAMPLRAQVNALLESQT